MSISWKRMSPQMVITKKINAWGEKSVGIDHRAEKYNANDNDAMLCPTAAVKKTLLS
jgi:hypothetical protein